MQPKAFTCALVLCAVAACGKGPDRDMSKDISRAAPPPRPTTTAPANTPANIGQPTHAEKQEGSNPQQGQVDPKESKQQKDFQQEGAPKDSKPSG